MPSVTATANAIAAERFRLVFNAVEIIVRLMGPIGIDETKPKIAPRHSLVRKMCKPPNYAHLSHILGLFLKY
jgi:hypothetical protein